MTKMLVFDMDGTIADLYGVEGWLSMLEAENPAPYEVAAPLYDMAELCELLNELRAASWTIAVTSWLAGKRKFSSLQRSCKTGEAGMACAPQLSC